MFSIAKYALSRTGLFPRWEPDVSDVLTAKNLVSDVKFLHNNRDVVRWYVFPRSWGYKYVMDIMRLFRANGVLLRPHYSRKYQEWVLVAPDLDQRFMSEVKTVCDDSSKFNEVKRNREEEVAERRIRFEKMQEIFGRSKGN